MLGFKSTLLVLVAVGIQVVCATTVGTMRQHSCAFTPYIDLTRKGSSRDVLKETAIRPMPRVCMLAMRWTERARDSTIPDRVVTARTSRANEVESMQRSVENGQGSCAPARSTKSSLSLNMQLLISRKRFAYSLLGAALTCAFKPKAAHAMTMRTLKRALVNIVRVREGSILLSTRLEDNLLDGFQDSVKLLVADTQLKENVNLACQGLSELQIDTSLRLAEEKGDRIVQFISNVVEYDGWDKMNRMDIREKFQKMTPEKIQFAKRGLTEVRKEIAAFLALFPPELITEAEELYRAVYVSS